MWCVLRTRRTLRALPQADFFDKNPQLKRDQQMKRQQTLTADGAARTSACRFMLFSPIKTTALLMEAATWWIQTHRLDHFEKAIKIKALLEDND